jgi:Fe-S-cluster containining protein
MVGDTMELTKNPCAKCCMDFDILPLDLLFPTRLSPKGREFVDAHGVLNKPLSVIMQHATELEGGLIKLHHRCDQLDDNGLCTIYDDRPAICREYVCASRKECTNQPIELKVVKSA